MWNNKFFRTYLDMINWIRNNENKYRIDIIFVENGYGVEYKKLIKM